MKQFADIFNLIPVFRTQSITNNQVVMKTGYSEDNFISRNDVEPKVTTENNAAGIVHKYQVEMAVEKLTDEEKRIYANDAPVIVQLFDADTYKGVLLGAIDNPASITMIPSFDYDLLKIEFISKDPVY